MTHLLPLVFDYRVFSLWWTQGVFVFGISAWANSYRDYGSIHRGSVSLNTSLFIICMILKWFMIVFFPLINPLRVLGRIVVYN